jgi:energy-coupling factor transport system permease protein
MSEFEYLSKIALGQYLPANSPIHRLNPGIKLAGYILLILAVTLSKQLAGLGIALIAILLLLLLSQIPITFTLRGLRSPLPFILILAVFQLFMVSQRSSETPFFAWLFLQATMDGLLSAGMLCLRFIELVLLLSAASSTLSTLEIVYGLDILLHPLTWLGISTAPASMIIQIMLRFLPSLALSAEKIAKAQASRGAAWGNRKAGLIQKGRQLLPFLIPLFNVNLQQADALANAMLARCYGFNQKRTTLTGYSFGWKDAVSLSGVLVLAFLILFFAGTHFVF